MEPRGPRSQGRQGLSGPSVGPPASATSRKKPPDGRHEIALAGWETTAEAPASAPRTRARAKSFLTMAGIDLLRVPLGCANPDRFRLSVGERGCRPPAFQADRVRVALSFRPCRHGRRPRARPVGAWWKGVGAPDRPRGQLPAALLREFARPVRAALR